MSDPVPAAEPSAVAREAVSPGSPPVAARRPLTRSAHGVDRVDEYAWLAVAGDPQVTAYLSAERAHHDAATDHLDSLSAGLADELTGRTPGAERSVSWKRGGFFYYTVRAEGEEYERIYRRDISSEQDVDPVGGTDQPGEPDAADQLVLDLGALAAGSEYLDVGLVEPSPDGRLVAYSVDLTGAEVFQLRFRDVGAGADLPAPDVVEGTYYTGAWSADSASFLYTVPDEAYRPDRIRRHRLGTPPSSDELVRAEPDRRFDLEVAGSRDGGWIVITSSSRDTSEVWLVPASDPAQPARLVRPRERGVEYAVTPLPGGWSGADADRLLIVTNRDDGEFSLVEAPVPAAGQAGDGSDWVAVPSGRGSSPERLEFAAALAGHVVLGVRADVEPFLRVLARSPGAAPFEIRSGVPCGQVALWRAEDYDAETVVVVEQSLVTPPTWVEVRLDDGRRRELRRIEVPGTDLTRYATRRIEVPSPARHPDGPVSAADAVDVTVLVPVTLAYRPDLVGGPDGEPDGRSPGLLYGYGAYEASSWPEFEVGTLSLLDRGVVYAVAHVRGGGERGRSWWLDGRLRAKQHTVDDFVAAADGLARTGWVDGARIASRGLSAGGLLQAAAFSQAPDRWRAVVAEVPFVDVVTTMSDPSIPLTVNEWDEWGDPITSPEDFAAMLAYSPYDNPPPPGARPPLLVTGAVHDPRVLVHEPAKWVARLRATDPDAPSDRLLFRVELGEGAHTGPSGVHGHLRYEAEILAWILDRLGAA